MCTLQAVACCEGCINTGQHSRMTGRRTSSSAEDEHNADDADDRSDQRSGGSRAAAATRQRGVAAAGTPRQPVSNGAREALLHCTLAMSAVCMQVRNDGQS